MHSPAQEIKERLTIYDLVSSYIKLEKAGQNWKACCPFHNEKTPSFIVSPARGTYHCFGCNKGGDIFSFVEEIEGIDFREALEKLAARAGVTLRAIDPLEVSRQKALYDCMELATRFFEFVLKRTPNAMDYLHSRGLTDASIETWRIGYAPADWRKLTTFLREKKMSDEVIEKVGLAIRSDKAKSASGGSPDAQSAFRGLYDRFRGRIMFPICDGQGRVVAFSGRIDPNGANQSDMAKYVNSPETPLYNKSKILYGYDRAKTSIMREDSCVLVEGQVDLVMAHQAGTTNAVAVSGTALTAQHLALIKRFTDNLIMSFDGDSAGFAAAKRGVGLALGLGMDVKIAALPEGNDPADVIATNLEQWKEALASATHIITFSLAHLSARELPEREFIKEVTAEVLPFVAAIGNRIDQEHFIHTIAHTLRVTEDAVREELKKIIALNSDENAARQKDIPRISSTSPDSSIREKIFGIMLWQENMAAPAVPLDIVAKEYARITASDLTDDLALIPEAKKQDLILQAEVYYAGHEKLAVELEELLLSLEDAHLRDTLAAALAELKRSSTPDDPVLVTKVHDIQRRRDSIRNSRFQEK